MKNGKLNRYLISYLSINYILLLLIVSYIYRNPTRIYSSTIKTLPFKKPIQFPTIKIEKLNSIWMFVGSAGYIGCRYVFNGSNLVHCEQKKLEKVSTDNFDWNTFLSYLSPDLFNLLAAIAVSYHCIIIFI